MSKDDASTALDMDRNTGPVDNLLSGISSTMIIVIAVINNVYDGDCGQVRFWLDVLLWAYVA